MEIIYCRIPHPQPPKGSNCHLQLAYVTWGEKSPLEDLGVKIQMRHYIVFHT